MLYFLINDGKILINHGKVVDVKDVHQTDNAYQSRWDWNSFAEVQAIADSANALNNGNHYLAVDGGEWLSPRFDVTIAPKIGAKVSYGFNGDYYPDGTIVSMSESFKRVVTSTGNVYYRRKLSASWKRTGGTWSMVQGHIDERNPSF
jgi:hypothetical protein